MIKASKMKGLKAPSRAQKMREMRDMAQRKGRALFGSKLGKRVKPTRAPGAVPAKPPKAAVSVSGLAGIKPPSKTQKQKEMTQMARSGGRARPSKQAFKSAVAISKLANIKPPSKKQKMKEMEQIAQHKPQHKPRDRQQQKKMPVSGEGAQLRASEEEVAEMLAKRLGNELAAQKKSPPKRPRKPSRLRKKMQRTVSVTALAGVASPSKKQKNKELGQEVGRAGGASSRGGRKKRASAAAKVAASPKRRGRGRGRGVRAALAMAQFRQRAGRGRGRGAPVPGAARQKPGRGRGRRTASGRPDKTAAAASKLANVRAPSKKQKLLEKAKTKAMHRRNKADPAQQFADAGGDGAWERKPEDDSSDSDSSLDDVVL